MEPISAEASKCRHCHSDLTSYKKRKGSRIARFDNFRLGFVTGILFTLIVSLLIYGQFFLGE
jgi:hypothetical protein